VESVFQQFLLKRVVLCGVLFAFSCEHIRFARRKTALVDAQFASAPRQAAHPMSHEFEKLGSVRLAAHPIDLSGMFVIVTVLAIVLSLLVKASRIVGAPELVVHILTFLEYAILIADAFVLLCYLARCARKFLRETE